MKFLLYLCALVICIPSAPPCAKYLAKSRILRHSDRIKITKTK